MVKEAFQQLLKKIGTDRQTLLFAAGLLGIALIALAPKATAREADPVLSASVEETAEAYATQLEDRLTKFRGEVEGVGKVRVMITLSSGYGYVYAKEEKSNSDRLEDSKNSDGLKTQEKNVTEETYILVDNPEGGKEPVITARIQPEIQGVVVVCTGGGNPAVVARVLETVTVALDVPTTRIAVSQLASEGA